MKLIQRHESLRTYFILDEQYIPIQKIKENIDFKCQFDTCTKSELDTLIKDFSQPFNLEKAPLLKAHLVANGY